MRTVPVTLTVAASLPLLVALAACADEAAPTWPAEAAVAVVSTTGTTLTVSWPAATDDNGVTAYAVAVDGAPVARLGTGTRQHTVDALAERSEHEISVVAYDEAGNAAAPIAVTARTADETAPLFPVGAALTLTERAGDAAAGSDAQIELTWPAATDASNAVRYVVRRGDEELASTEARTHTVPRPDVETMFVVVALDDQDNESPALEARFTPAREASAIVATARAHEGRMMMLLGALGHTGGGLADVFAAPSGSMELAAQIDGVGVLGTGTGSAATSSGPRTGVSGGIRTDRRTTTASAPGTAD